MDGIDSESDISSHDSFDDAEEDKLSVAKLSAQVDSAKNSAKSSAKNSIANKNGQTVSNIAIQNQY